MREQGNTARDERGQATYPPVVDDTVPCACGAVTLVYVSARFVENNVVHASDECQDFGQPDAFDASPKAVAVHLHAPSQATAATR